MKMERYIDRKLDRKDVTKIGRFIHFLDRRLRSPLESFDIPVYAPELASYVHSKTPLIPRPYPVLDK